MEDVTIEIAKQREILDDVKLECNEKCVITNKYGECMYQCLKEHGIHEFLIWEELGGPHVPGDVIDMKFKVKLNIPENIKRLAIPTSWVKLSLNEINKTFVITSEEKPVESEPRIISLFDAPIRRINEDPKAYINDIRSVAKYQMYYAVLDKTIPHVLIPAKVTKVGDIISYSPLGEKLGHYITFEKTECDNTGCHWQLTDEKPEAYVDEYSLQIRGFNSFRVFRLLNVSNALVHKSVFISTPAITITVSGIQDAMASVYFIAPTTSKVEIEFEIKDLLKDNGYVKDKVEFLWKGTDTPARW